MREIRTSIEIAASAEKIWSILMNFERYCEWNSFIIDISGKPKPRERLRVKIQPPGSSPMIFKPQVTVVEKSKTFGWLGSLFMRGVFDGHHVFEIEEIGDRCRFVQREEFSGLLVPVLWKNLNTRTRAGFEAMNNELRVLAEGT